MKVLQTLFKSDNAYWLQDSPQQHLYLYLQIDAMKAEKPENRPPLNISLVIDRSGSMSGDKIRYAKKAVEFVIKNLSSEDYLSVVQYDDRVDVVSSSQKLTHKKMLLQKVEQISARATTNLSGGMLAGYEQVHSTKQQKYVNRVLLLSDGLANVGITQPDQLQQIAQQRFREQGIGLSTFGVGADYNELLMTNLAEYGGANYYFIDNPDKIPTIFAEELSGLLAVVAQNLSFELHFPGDTLQCEKVYGYPAEIQHDTVRIPFNDLFSEETKAILLQFKLNRPLNQDLQFQGQLRYTEASGSFAQQTTDLPLTIRISTNKELVTQHADKLVIEQTTLFLTNEWFEEAVTLSDRGNFKAAKERLEQIKLYLEKHFQNIPASPELKKHYEQVVAFIDKVSRMDEMSQVERTMSVKSARSMSYRIRKKK